MPSRRLLGLSQLRTVQPNCVPLSAEGLAALHSRAAKSPKQRRGSSCPRQRYENCSRRGHDREPRSVGPRGTRARHEPRPGRLSRGGCLSRGPRVARDARQTAHRRTWTARGSPRLRLRCSSCLSALWHLDPAPAAVVQRSPGFHAVCLAQRAAPAARPSPAGQVGHRQGSSVQPGLQSRLAVFPRLQAAIWPSTFGRVGADSACETAEPCPTFSWPGALA